MNEIKLPETIGGHQGKMRLAFQAGATWQRNSVRASQAEAERESRRRYPITRRVPRTAEIKDHMGFAWYVRVENSGFTASHRPEGPFTHKHHTLTPESVHALADLLDNPYEEVEE